MEEIVLLEFGFYDKKTWHGDLGNENHEQFVSLHSCDKMSRFREINTLVTPASAGCQGNLEVR